MEQKNPGKHQFIDVAGTKVLVGSKWEDEPKLKGILFRFSVKQKAATAKIHFAATRVVDTDKSNVIQQYSLVDIESAEGIVSGDLVFANNVSKWSPNSQGDKVVLIKSLPGDENDILSEPKYWLVALEPNGSFSPIESSILNDRFELEEAINVLTLMGDNIKVLNVDMDGAARAATEDLLGEAEYAEIIEIQEDTFNKAFEENAASIERVYKPSKIKIKKVGLVAALIAAATVGAFSFSYITQSEAFSYLENDSVLSELDSKTARFGKISKGLKSSSKWNPDNFRTTTLNQLAEDLGRSVFSPLDIPHIIKEIDRSLPLFSSEWKFSKITFGNNRFYVTYERLTDGQGVFFLLDQDIQKISDDNPYLKFSPQHLLNEGTTRTYLVTPSIKLARQDMVFDMKERLAEEARQRTSVAKHAKRAGDHARKMSQAFSDYQALTFQQKWLTRDALEIHAGVEENQQKMVRYEKSLKDAMQKRRQAGKYELDETIILGNKMDFITMMQLDSFFQWAPPELDGGYPDGNTLSAMKPKKKKKKGAKEADKYLTAIERYTVTITTREKEEEGKIPSYGISDMIRLGFLLNKPFVNVDAVDYTKDTEQWEFHVHFHRRTPEYIKRIVTNKEVEK